MPGGKVWQCHQGEEANTHQRVNQLPWTHLPGQNGEGHHRHGAQGRDDFKPSLLLIHAFPTWKGEEGPCEDEGGQEGLVGFVIDALLQNCFFICRKARLCHVVVRQLPVQFDTQKGFFFFPRWLRQISRIQAVHN